MIQPPADNGVACAAWRAAGATRATRKRLAAAALAALLVCTAASAAAQTLPVPEPSPALSCLAVAPGEPDQPEYPFDLYKSGTPGRVKASVTLPGGLFGNKVEVLERDGDPAFAASSRSFLRALRAPCLKEGETVTLSYEFVFQPDRREVVWRRPTDNTDAERKAMAACIRHERGEKSPDYPTNARRREEEARLAAVLTFTSADAPPSMELMHRPSAESFAPAIRSWVAGLRMPCHAGGPVQLRYHYVFRLEGNSAFGFKPLTLLQVLAVSKGMRERELVLDTTTMGCPFDLKLSYLQPFRPNSVGEVGGSNPSRRPLLELLSNIELDLRGRELDSVFADTADVAVPCVKLNLKPQEKKS